MGIRFRKSFNFGPLRATLSKSGVSISAGVKGARITKKANGNIATTVGIPGSGIYYTKEKKVRKINTNRKEEQIMIRENTNNIIEECDAAIVNYPEENIEVPDNWYDLIIFSNTEEQKMFLCAYLTSAQAQCDDTALTDVYAPFKVADINNAAAKNSWGRNFTSAHLGKMVDKGWFIRENRGTYKISEEAVAPYIEQFKKLQEQQRLIEEQRKYKEQKEAEAKQKYLEQQAIEQAEKERLLKIQQEAKAQQDAINQQVSLQVRRIFAIFFACLGLGIFGVPSLLCKQPKWFGFSWLCLVAGGLIPVFLPLVALTCLVIIPIISVKQIK